MTNWLGAYTLYIKEVNRFLNVYNQTIIAPMINAILLMSVFSLSLGEKVAEIHGIPLKEFIIPGLIMMSIVQNAFANTSSTLTFGKVLGAIIDVLLPPLSPRDITLAMSLGGVTRGIISGLGVAAAILLLEYISDTPKVLGVYNFGLIVFYVFFSALMLSLLGMITGILSESFDQMTAITSFVVTPLSFLSGTFYSIQNLPTFWQNFNLFNPFFYMIDGFRYALTGHADASITHGMIMLIVFNCILFAIVYMMIKKGFRLKY